MVRRAPSTAPRASRPIRCGSDGLPKREDRNGSIASCASAHSGDVAA